MTWKILMGDCIEQMRTLPDCSVDAVVTDPPYALSFMGKPWDAFDGREDAGFASWLAGFIDGEGCFTVKGHSRGTYAPSFRIKLRSDDAGILEGIRRTVGIGTVSNIPGSGGSEDQVAWTVSDKEGCQRLVDLLDKYPLRAKKRNDFLIWREAVCEWTTRPRGNRWDGPADQTRIKALREALMEGRHYTEVAWSGHEFQDWCRLWAGQALRVLKPGGHLVSFASTRTYHRMAAGVEDAGFEIRDMVAWMFGSGFPKSLDVSKAIDKAAGVEREVVGYDASRARPNRKYEAGAIGNIGGNGKVSDRSDNGATITAPATPEAEQWAGWGTALKPGHEPIVLARKPLIGTVAQNVQQHGTGALHIDGCRVGPRWPANVALDPEAGVMLDEQTGELVSGSEGTDGHRRNADKSRNTYGEFAGTEVERGVLYGDRGGASRFFYSAKASQAERNAGTRGGDGNGHPTVKPVSLMRWLVRLITPPGGVVLDPFLGSGTTGIAAVLEGCEFIGCEREASYVEIASARIAWWEANPAAGDDLAEAIKAERALLEAAAEYDGDLFS